MAKANETVTELDLDIENEYDDDEQDQTLCEMQVTEDEPFELPLNLRLEGITEDDLIEAQEYNQQLLVEEQRRQWEEERRSLEAQEQEMSLQLSDSELGSEVGSSVSSSSDKENKDPKEPKKKKANSDQVMFGKLGWTELMQKVADYIRWPTDLRKKNWPWENMDRDRKNAWKKLCKDYELKDNFLMKKIKTKTKKEVGDDIEGHHIEDVTGCKYDFKNACYTIKVVIAKSGKVTCTKI